MHEASIRFLFWFAISFVLYTYIAYPLIVAAIARLRPRQPLRRSYSGSVSFVMTVRNESAGVARQVRGLCVQLDKAGCDGEVIVVSDGSTDATAREAGGVHDSRVRVLDLPSGVGKAAALSHGCKVATGDVLVLADVRQRWHPDALRLLLQNFEDPKVGAVSGQLTLVDAQGVAAGVGLYWRFERWLRRTEARVHSVVGVSGSICAVRRKLLAPIPAGTVLDDVYWPMRVVMAGYRVVYEEEALAIDRLPASSSDEFRRKVRTLTGNFQLVARLPTLLLPWRNPIWWQFVSHKLLRLLVPWMLIIALVSSMSIHTGLYGFAFYAQALLYALGLVGLVGTARLQSRLTSALAAFIMLNAAAWMAFWIWVTGGVEHSWKTVDYGPDPSGSKV